MIPVPFVKVRFDDAQEFRAGVLPALSFLISWLTGAWAMLLP
jgi:hypothetical protein